ncbi:MAG: response regulator [Kordiimonadaceae bacterium]|nr:response regulator [Kordiimonadaceae bacterium]
MSLILHVDDDRVMRNLVSEYLTDAGYEVVSAENGQEGMEIAEKIIPDLILMDIDMPVLDGYAATQKLRGHGYSGLIAALTGSERVRDLANALVAGCDDFIPKPLTKNFPDQVKAILDRKNAPPDNATVKTEDEFFE